MDDILGERAFLATVVPALLVGIAAGVATFYIADLLNAAGFTGAALLIQGLEWIRQVIEVTLLGQVLRDGAAARAATVIGVLASAGVGYKAMLGTARFFYPLSAAAFPNDRDIDNTE